MLEHNDHSFVPRAVDACWRSHQKVYALVAQNPGNTNCLILEDDAVLNSHLNWRAFLVDLDEYMTRASIDVLQLGFLEPTSIVTRMEIVIRSALTRIFSIVFRRRPGEQTIATDNHWDGVAQPPHNVDLVPYSFLAGAHCYVVSKRVAGALLGLNTPTFTGCDDFFVCFAENQEDYGRFRIARVEKSLAVQRSRIRGERLDSDIESSIQG